MLAAMQDKHVERALSPIPNGQLIGVAAAVFVLGSAIAIEDRGPALAFHNSALSDVASLPGLPTLLPSEK